MDWSHISANWPAFAASIKAMWPSVDQDEVADLDGTRASFEAYLETKLGLDASDVQQQINTWLAGPLPIDAATNPFHDNASIKDSGQHIPVGEDVYSEDRDFGDDRTPAQPVGRRDE